MFFVFRSHGQWFVDELVLLGLLGLDGQRDGPGPVLAVHHRPQLPRLVRAVRHRNELHVLLADVGREMLDLLNRRHAGAHAGQGQGHRAVRASFQEASQLLINNIYFFFKVRFLIQSYVRYYKFVKRQKININFQNNLIYTSGLNE